MRTEHRSQRPSNHTFSFVETLSSRHLVAKFLPLQRIEALYARVRCGAGENWFDRLLAEMQIRYQVAERDLERMPRRGPALCVSNHPFGMLDGAVLGALLSGIRPDFKIMTNFLLAGIPELEEHCIFVDPMNGREAIHKNRAALKHALQWLRDGHLLAVFPAGEVSHLQLTQRRITDPAWNPMIAHLARLTSAEVVPVFFPGRNSVTFQALGVVHPQLRTAWLAGEFLNQTGRSLAVRIGNPISAEVVSRMPHDEETIDYLRRRVYLLAKRGTSDRHFPFQSLTPKPFSAKRQAAIADEIQSEVLASELSNLSSEQCLSETRDFSVHVARARQIPNLLLELGRLREITFRAAGEGTGESRDLDSFDDDYLHLFLWDKASRRLAGAYRMGICPEILRSHGPKGLYTSTLFKYDPEFFEQLGPAVELGRSFVLPAYQRQFAPLLLLWKGIAGYLAMHPETPILFGAVSISKEYSAASRELIVRYFDSRRQHQMAGMVRPRRPFRSSWLRPWDCAGICQSLINLEDLASSVSDLEVDSKGLPILLRQYAKLGGEFLAFNVDRQFSDVLDGLVVVDLRRTEPSALERYMGKAGLAHFRRYHDLLSYPVAPVMNHRNVSPEATYVT